MTTTEISVLTAIESENPLVIEELCHMINSVYRDDEKGIWNGNESRTNYSEIKQQIQLKRIVVARVDGDLCGCVCIYLLSDDIGSFGMLSVLPSFRRQRIGQSLVEFAEKEILRMGSSILEIDLLIPTNWKHPSKELLKTWYMKQGYRKVTTRNITEIYDDKTAFLATECSVIVYRKELINE